MTARPPCPDAPRTAAALTPAEARALFRAGLRVPTSGWSAGWTQANLLAVPRDLAYDFLLFAQRNPAACPVLDVTEPGEVGAPRFAATCAPTCRPTGSTSTARWSPRSTT